MPYQTLTAVQQRQKALVVDLDDPFLAARMATQEKRNAQPYDFSRSRRQPATIEQRFRLVRK